MTRATTDHETGRPISIISSSHIDNDRCMKGLDLYKFVKDNSLEWHKYDGKEIILFIPFGLLGEFTVMVGDSRFDEGGQDVTLKDDCIALDVQPLCDDFDIESGEVFVGDHYDS